MDNFNALTITILKDIILPILIAIATSILAVRRSVFQAKMDLQKEYDSRFNTKKWETYLGMNEIIQEIYSGKQPVDTDSIGLENKIGSLRNQILLIGSNSVVNAFVLWQKQRAVQSDSHPDTFAKLHILIVEMRKDLGLQDSMLELEVARGLFPRYR